MVRAAIMGGLSAFALVVGRQSHALTSLFATAWLMTAWQPFVLWDAGAQLSFGASLGLIAYAERLSLTFEDLLRKFVSLEEAVGATKLLAGNLLSTVAAMITTLPLMVYHFGSFTPWSLVSNLLVLPVQPAVMYLGASATLVGLVWLPLGRLVGWAAWLFLTYTIRAVEFTAKWVDTAAPVRALHPAMLLAYGGALLLFAHRPPRALFSAVAWKRFLRRPVVRRASFSALFIAAVLVWSTVAGLPDGKLHVAFLDVGQGDAILVTTPAGRRLLIDGGPSPSALLDALGRRMPFWERRIDLILLTHPHDDHLRGLLDLPERYDIGLVLLSDVEHDSGVHGQWQESLRVAGLPTLVVQQPWQIEFGDGPVMEVVPPASPNPDSLDDTSLVSRLVWQQARFLFTGDLEAEGLLKLSDEGWPLDCTVLKVPHHGSSEAVSPELLSATHPSVAVISAGADNRFGHPADETLACLEEAGVRVLRTDTAGSIEVTTDGVEYWVQTAGKR